MIEWGFDINNDSQIDFDANDRSLCEFILQKDSSFSVCIGCGGCTAACTSGLFTELNIRRLFTLIKRGQTDHIKDDIKLCLLCGKCLLVCPRGVNTINIIRILYEKL